MLGAALVLAACRSDGGDARGGSAGSSPPKAPLRLTCNQSWVPNERTFLGVFRSWRSNSVRIGPITLMAALAQRRAVAAGRTIKFRTLVRPRTALTITIDRDALSAVRFVDPYDAERGIVGRGAAALALAPCPPVPRDVRVIPGLAAIGYPVVLRVQRNACVGMTVQLVGRGRRFRGRVPIGSARCGP